MPNTRSATPAVSAASFSSASARSLSPRPLALAIIAMVPVFIDMNAVFKQSLPFFEKAHELAPEDRSYLQTLKALYYRFGMNDKYEEVSAKLNNL